MKHAMRKWGGWCLILGSLLMGVGNVLHETGWAAESVMLPNLVLWGHGLLAFGIIGLADMLINENNRNRIAVFTMLFIFGNVLLGAGIGALILEASGELSTSIQALAEGNTSVMANFMIAHFGYVIGLLILLMSAVGHPSLSKGGVYILMLGTLLVAIGPFTPVWIFATGFGLSLIGGVWLGADIVRDTAEESESAEAAAEFA